MIYLYPVVTFISSLANGLISPSHLLTLKFTYSRFLAFRYGSQNKRPDYVQESNSRLRTTIVIYLRCLTVSIIHVEVSRHCALLISFFAPPPPPPPPNYGSILYYIIAVAVWVLFLICMEPLPLIGLAPLEEKEERSALAPSSI